MTTIHQLEQDILSLPSEARALLAEKILESLDSTEAKRIHDIWVQEVKKRFDDLRSGRVKFLPGREVIAFLGNA